jgi:GT2 family glycosyltransferase
MNKKKTKLSLVILTYNCQFWLKKTLESLKEHYLDKSKYKIEVFVVDNHSSDETLALLKASFGWVTIIESNKNLGFSAGNNLALRIINSDYVMLLNSDLEFLPDSNLDILIKHLDTNPKIGIITPRLEFTNHKIDPASHRGEPTLWASLTYFFKLEAIFPKNKLFGQYHQFYKDLSSVHTIDACSGAAMMVRVSAIKKVGLLDERFFMYAEDLDWCKRFRDHHYQIVYDPRIRIIHHKYKSGIKSSSKKIAFQTNKHFYDTMLQYYDKHYANNYPKLLRILIRYYLAIKKEGV